MTIVDYGMGNLRSVAKAVERVGGRAGLSDRVDRAPSDARLDLERHTVAAERPGYLLRVYESLVALEYAARSLAAGTTRSR